MLPFKCVVIDDDDAAISILTNYIGAHSGLALSKTFTDPLSALAGIGPKDHIDFLFLDIDMPDMTGIELARRIGNKVRFIIFITAFKKYGIEAVGVHASAYLLKPFSKTIFTETIAKVLDHELRVLKAATMGAPSSCFLTTGERGSLIEIKFADILYVEGLKNYVLIVTPAKRHIAYLTMKETQTGLRSKSFFRVHRSYIINAEKVEKVCGNQVLIYGKKIALSKNYREAFLAYLDQRTLKSGR